MPASEAMIELWKRLFIFIMFIVIIVAFLSSIWLYMSYSEKALKLRNARISTQEALAAWSNNGNVSGIINLQKINSSDLSPCTNVSIFYTNGTLAKEVSSSCP